MDGLVSRASMIRLSLHPLPASETSAFNKIRAFSTRRAGLFPFRIRVSSRSRSSPLSLTTYFFTGQHVFHSGYERAVGLRRDDPVLAAMGAPPSTPCSAP